MGIQHAEWTATRPQTTGIPKDGGLVASEYCSQGGEIASVPPNAVTLILF